MEWSNVVPWPTVSCPVPESMAKLPPSVPPSEYVRVLPSGSFAVNGAPTFSPAWAISATVRVVGDVSRNRGALFTGNVCWTPLERPRAMSVPSELYANIQ